MSYQSRFRQFHGETAPDLMNADASGDYFSPTVGLYDKNLNHVRTLYSNPMREKFQMITRADSKLELVLAKQPKPFWKPHYEMSTKTTEMRKNETQDTKANMAYKSFVPFVAGTSLSPSHNIFLSCQQVLAHFQANQRQLPKEVVKKEPGLVLNCNQSEVSFVFTQGQFNDENSEKFKIVIKNLYKEFAALSREYDDYVQALAIKGVNKKYVKKELKKLEEKLDQKGQEILILINLYREVINLKEQLTLKDNMKMLKPDQAVNISPSLNFKLNFLLHQVQKFEKLLIKSKK